MSQTRIVLAHVPAADGLALLAELISTDICLGVWPVWCPCGCGHISDGAPLVPTRSAVVAATIMLEVGRLDTAAFARVMRRSHPFYALVFSSGGDA